MQTKKCIKTSTIAILGAGSWGTAVAIHLAHVGHRVMLWTHKPQHALNMATMRMNNRYLPETIFPDQLTPSSDLNECMTIADYIIIAVPSHAFTEILSQLSKPRNGLAWLTKGLNPGDHLLLSQVVAMRFGEDYPIAVISGPSFATEVAHLLPTALTLAGNNLAFQQVIQQCLHHNNLRVYLSSDIIGIQICGAVKNVLAIACGISDGLGYGANAKAAIITRGLAEMRRLGLALGAKEESFMGLAGVGDLVLTCTDNQSRNRRFGLFLGQGLTSNDAEKQINQVVEGRHNAMQICELAKQYHVELPICTQVNALLNNTITLKEAVARLMDRAVGVE